MKWYKALVANEYECTVLAKNEMEARAEFMLMGKDRTGLPYVQISIRNVEEIPTDTAKLLEA